MVRTSESQRAAVADRIPAIAAGLESEIAKAVIGQKDVVRQVLLTLFVGGHALVRGVPGLAKTLLVKSLAGALDLSFNRIQFTPDLMPGDILGNEVLEEDKVTGRRETRFIKGPVFCQVLLADEINRTPPKTQAALLEAMQERQVTVAGVRYSLPSPFFVMATQNPIEQEGTYRLPEAELDRFLFNITIDYPAFEDEERILSETTSSNTPSIQPLADAELILTIQDVVRDVAAASNIVRYAARLVRASRPNTADTTAFAREWIAWGAGPRAGQALLLGAKASALIDGRFAASFDDIRRVAHPVLRHRIIPNFHAEAEGVNSDTIVDRLLSETPLD
ncbi:MAG TPA: MoxR family ATPase [Blastocatellia bacterium]|nr:MoxR family ATPase [Blastocatellia bacterium]